MTKDKRLVRVRAEQDDGVWAYSFSDGCPMILYNAEPLYSSSGIVPDLDDDDCQENYWVVETEDGSKFACQSIDVEEVPTTRGKHVVVF